MKRAQDAFDRLEGQYSLREALAAMPPGFQLDQETLEAKLIKHCQYDKRKKKNLFQRLESLG